jgi:hypothetical protein
MWVYSGVFTRSSAHSLCNVICTCTNVRGLYIGKYPGGGISADVIWGKNYEKVKIKRGENVKEKGRKGKEKGKKSERKRKKGERK